MGLGGNIAESLISVRVRVRVRVRVSPNPNPNPNLNPNQGADAISAYWSVQQIPPEVSRAAEDAGNGSIMRLAPVALRFSRDLRCAMRVAAKQSRATHPGRKAADASVLLARVRP